VDGQKSRCKSAVQLDFEKPVLGFFPTVGLGLSLDRVLKRPEKVFLVLESNGKAFVGCCDSSSLQRSRPWTEAAFKSPVCSVGGAGWVGC
jgi:hypothetical protein